MKNYLKEIRLHVAGATVRHRSPFAELPVPENTAELSEEFYEKWVVPFYMARFSDDSFLQNLKPMAPELSKEIVISLLGEFNWRPRIVGAWFSAIKRYVEFDKVIGNLLLRSDVCYAGDGYCQALASFNTSHSIEALSEYLEYYLTKPELWFDQSSAMAAIAYLDQINQTQNLNQFVPAWERFVKNKPHWDLARNIQSFAKQMEAALKIRSSFGFL